MMELNICTNALDILIVQNQNEHTHTHTQIVFYAHMQNLL